MDLELINLTKTQAAQLGSLAQLIDKKCIAPILVSGTIEVFSSKLTARTTDRYLIAEYKTEIEQDPETELSEMVILPLAAFSFIATAAKSGGVSIEIRHPEKSATILAANGATLSTELLSGTYPDIAPMMQNARESDGTTPNGYPIAVRHYERMAKAAKLFSPDATLTAKPTATDTAKPSPVLFEIETATPSPGTAIGTLSVLVQPNRKSVS